MSLEVFRALLSSLRTTARTPAGIVVPKCSGIRANKYPNSGSITWEEPPRSPQSSRPYILCATLPASYITVHFSLDGDLLHCDLTVNLHRGRKFALNNGADTNKLESLVEHLRELAKWL